MSRLGTTRTARGIVDMIGGHSRLYVPGSLRITLGGLVFWSERCHSGCEHGGTCIIERRAHIPTGRVDTDSEGRG